MDFRVQLDHYRGPLDLLVYLVRKHELSPLALPLGAIAEQYVAYLEAQTTLDVNEVGDFIELATTLVEIKSRQVLPHVDESADAEVMLEDPQENLVSRLLEYKNFKDAASVLDERSRLWQRHYVRLSNDLVPRKIDPGDQPIDELEVWDLVNAFNRFQFQSSEARDTTIVYDDTPLPVHMQRIWEELDSNAEIDFGGALQSGMPKSALIGMFLAVLELMRHQRIHAEQSGSGLGLFLRKGPRFRDGWHVMPDNAAAA
jgi:segregation and condensation protein A